MKLAKITSSALITGAIVLLAAACGGEPNSSQVSPTVRYALYDHADVINVSITGVPGEYSVSVTVSSDDRGCGSYVDWWEVVSEEGELLTRRVLLHSHVDEQPFTRSGGPLNVQSDDLLIIRAHMNGCWVRQYRDAGNGSRRIYAKRAFSRICGRLGDPAAVTNGLRVLNGNSP